MNQLGIIHPRLTEQLYPYEFAHTSTGRIYTYIGGTANGYGIPANTYAASDVIGCGFEPISSEKLELGRVGLIDGKARLPRGTDIKEHDYFLLITRYGINLTATAVVNGSTVTGQLYRVFGPPVEGAAGIQVELKLVSEAVTL